MTYSTRADTEAIFGTHNIAQWASIDNIEDDDAIATRVTSQITEAFTQINGRLKDCRYTVPFVATIDPIIVTLSARLVGVLLYDSRHLTDVEGFDQLQNFRRMVEEQYIQIMGGKLKLTSYAVTAVNYPQNITVFDEDE